MITVRLVRALGADRSVDGLDPGELRAWLADLRTTLAPISVAGYVRTLRVLGNWLAAEGLAEAAALRGLRRPRVPPKVIEPVADDLLRRLLSVCSVRDRAIVLLMLDTGLRDLLGGAYGQHGMQYMTGEVQADFLDDAVDLIATNRAAVLWEDPRARPLLEWGQQKVRDLLGDWVTRRQQAHERHLRDTTPYFARLERFPEREQAELRTAITKLAAVETIDDQRLDELVGYLFKAYENETFMQLIRAISGTDENAQDELLRLFLEWDVLEAISVAQTVRGRIEVVRKFRAMIGARVPEKPDMQDFVRLRP